MLDPTQVVAELEEQRCLIEQQRVEIQRMQRHITLQRELLGIILTELETLKNHPPTSRKRTTRKPTNGHERVMTSRDSSEGMSSDNPT
jgi:hypothetical protein